MSARAKLARLRRLAREKEVAKSSYLDWYERDAWLAVEYARARLMADLAGESEEELAARLADLEESCGPEPVMPDYLREEAEERAEPLRERLLKLQEKTRRQS
jgi:hypothetical protein